MHNYFSLYSIVFMMGFVAVFDGLHRRKRFVRLFQSMCLFSPEEVNQLQTIWEACQDS